MKKITLTLMVALLSTHLFADTILLKCNPPMGSSLQEVKINRVGKKFFLTELNMAGARSAPAEIKATSWVKRDLKWISMKEGNVHLYKLKGRSNWSYAATNIGSTVIGYCEE